MTIESLLRPLTSRQSTPSRLLGSPGPSDNELRALVEAAAQVPDHGRLQPWRLLSIRGDARNALGRALVAVREARAEPFDEAAKMKDLGRFSKAPVILAVIAKIRPNHKIPAVEQLMSAAALAQNLLIGANALGYGAQWLTGWAAYDREILALLGLQEHEQIVAFVHLGTPQSPTAPRERPKYEQLVQQWQPADTTAG